MKRYNVYISRIYTYSPIIEAESYEEAIEKAGEIADELLVDKMIFADENVGVEERRERYGKESFG